MERAKKKQKVRESRKEKVESEGERESKRVKLEKCRTTRV